MQIDNDNLCILDITTKDRCIRTELIRNYGSVIAQFIRIIRDTN